MTTDTTDTKIRASESIAVRFDRTMNAATSKWGFLTDFSIAFAIAAIPTLMVVRQLMFDDPKSPLTFVLVGLALLPIVVAIGISIALTRARDEVVTFLSSVPFEIDNMNALLAGVTDEFVVVLDDDRELPTRADVQPKLDAVSDDALLVRQDDERHELTIKIGVPHNKHLPLRATHERYLRFQRLVREVLVPLSEQAPVRSIRIS